MKAINLHPDLRIKAFFSEDFLKPAATASWSQVEMKALWVAQGSATRQHDSRKSTLPAQQEEMSSQARPKHVCEEHHHIMTNDLRVLAWRKLPTFAVFQACASMGFYRLFYLQKASWPIQLLAFLMFLTWCTGKSQILASQFCGKNMRRQNKTGGLIQVLAFYPLWQRSTEKDYIHKSPQRQFRTCESWTLNHSWATFSDHPYLTDFKSFATSMSN